MKHIIAMNCRIDQLMEEHQVTIIRLINHLAAHTYELYWDSDYNLPDKWICLCEFCCEEYGGVD